MRRKIYWMVLMVLALGILRGQAQGPLHDQVTVNLPYAVTLGDRILEPAQYAIRQLTGTVLQIVKHPRNPEIMEVEATVMTLPTEKHTASDATLVVLQRFGNSYYFDKVWVQGKGTGYEFALPESVESLERERRMVSQVVLPATPGYNPEFYSDDE